MTGRCFVPGCKSGLNSARRQDRKEFKKHPQIFSAPKNWTMLQIWSHVIPEKGRKFSITDKVCELHFTEDYIAKFHEITLEDGEVFKLDRKFPKLRPGAIPIVFPLLPQYSKNVKKIVDQMYLMFPLHISEMDVKIDELMENYFKNILEVKEMYVSYSETAVCKAKKSSSSPNKNITVNFENMTAYDINSCTDDLDIEKGSRNMSDEDNNIITEAENVCSEYQDIDAMEESESESEEITFDVLVRNLNSVSKPNSSWSVTSHGKFVICAKWNKDYLPEKRVVIDHDLNIKAFLKDNQIAAYNNLCMTDVSDISNILSILDK